MPEIALIEKYFPHLTDSQRIQFSKLKELYSYWNERINVISRKDMDAFYEHHVLHSLAIAKVVQFKPGTMVLDIGTGGGFPGVPLAILFPETDFYLVDSIGKKIKVVNEVVNALQLTNVKAEHKKAEEVRAQFDFIVTRAVAPFSTLRSWIKGKIKPGGFNDLPNGMLALKGGDLSEELLGFERKVKIIEISVFFKEPFFETKKIVYSAIS